jgi:hypothetical protein
MNPTRAEVEWHRQNPPPKASEDVAQWLDEHVPIGAAWTVSDGPPEVLAYAAERQAWRDAYEAASVAWPVHHADGAPQVRFFGGAWLSSYASVIGDDGKTRRVYGYAAAMLAMDERGEREEDMRAIAARIYDYEGRMAHWTQEMADDLRRAMEGA